MLTTRGSRVIRRAAGALGVVAAFALSVLASVSSASFGESEAQASPPDGGSSFATRAQQGVVAPPDLDDIEQMCLLLTSCENIPIPHQFIPQDFHSCIKKMTEDMTQASAINFSLTLRECGLGANSCEDLRTCAHRGAKPDACKGRGPDAVVGSCDPDGRALSCWHDRVLAVRDCNRGGESCVVRDGQATCVLGVCPADIKAGDPPQCGRDGLHILRCEKGKLASLDCGAFGLRCGALNGAEGAGCVTSLPSCAPGSKRCEGNVAIGCFNGHEVKIDCAAAGHVCGTVPGGHAVGLCTAPPKAAECNVGDAATCDGAYVKYCFAGKQRRYFCKPRFNSCVKDNTGVHCR